jgi:hypothetical protein
MMRLFAAYLRERFRPAIFIPAIVLHTVAALWASGIAPTPGTIIQSAVLITLLMLQFRLWDDLEDREHDRTAHPERLVVHVDAKPFWRAVAGLAALTIALLAARGSEATLAGMALLNVFFCTAYRAIRPSLPDFAWRFHILLLKYPVFVVLIATMNGAAPAGRLTFAAFVIYGCSCAYEALHNRRAILGAT